MTNAFEYWAENGKYVEVYEVVRVAVVVKDEKTYRIEVLKGYVNPKIPFSTRCDVMETQNNGQKIWVAYELPWTCRDDADGALQQALNFLANAESLGVAR
jgi:hypothetical protein